MSLRSSTALRTSNAPPVVGLRPRRPAALEADAARARYQKIYARFSGDATDIDLAGAQVLRQRGRELEVITNGNLDAVVDRLRARSPESITTEALTLEEIFVATLQPGATGA